VPPKLIPPNLHFGNPGGEISGPFQELEKEGSSVEEFSPRLFGPALPEAERQTRAKRPLRRVKLRLNSKEGGILIWT